LPGSKGELSGKGKAKQEGRSGAEVAFDLDPAMVFVCELFADRQPQTDPLPFCGGVVLKKGF